MKLTNTGLLTRLLTGFGTILALSCLLGLIALQKLETVSGFTADLHDHSLAVATSVVEANAGIIAMHRSMKDVALAQDAAGIDSAAQAVDASEKQVFAAMAIAQELSRRGVRVVGVPKTIDNDLDNTYMTFGFDSAVGFATECLDRLHSTATSHRRVMVVEVMGRYAGWIALHAGLAGNAHAILIPEIPYDIGKVAELIGSRDRRGRMGTVVVVAEGARPRDGHATVRSHEIGTAERLGGVGEKVAAELEQLTGKEARTVVLGHLLRGGSPTSFDRLMALRFGAAAVRALAEGRSGVMVSLSPPTVRYVPLAETVQRLKMVGLDSDTIATARNLGVALGD